MATDKKISSLNSLNTSELDLVNDSLVIVNDNESKKITPNNLMSGRVQSSTVTNLVTLDQSAYDLLEINSSIDAGTLYIITI
tara:strand:- start:246 stop:491 length:246 start_codon:yes stop_codon:yes gene_type:complete